MLQVCVYSVCVHFGWVNAEHKFRVWVTILGRMSRHTFFKMYNGKAAFSAAVTLVLGIKWSFRNHSNILMPFKKKKILSITK